MTDEEWRDVVGYEGWYAISNHGRVMRTRGGTNTYPGRILKQGSDRDGYKNVGLSRNGSQKTAKVHHLVMVAFVGPMGNMQVNHIDGIKDNNRIDNLEYVTASQNIRHSIDVLGNKNTGAPIGTFAGERNPNSRLDSEKVAEIRRLLATNLYTQARIASMFNVSQLTISNISTEKTWRSVPAEAAQ